MSDDTAVTPDRQERLQEILLSYVEAAEAGTPPDQRSFVAAHPDFAAELKEFFASYHHLNRIATPLREDRASGPTQSGWLFGNSADHPPPDDLGQLGDYRLLSEIGRGGMGIVYEAEQLSLRRRVALKILPMIGGIDGRQLQRFRNEAEAAAHLHHSHIVPVFAVGSERGVHYYAMQLIEGQSLASLIGSLAEGSGAAADGEVAAITQAARAITTEHSGRTRRFFRAAATIGRQVAEALEYAHQMGVVHRDIKPANLLIDGRGDAWVTDFGLAQCQSQLGLTVTGELVGTLRYISPEQAQAKRGVVDHRTDIYSLGATLYEMLTLKPVFDGKDHHALLHQITFDDPKPPRAIDPSIPVELETVLLKALAKSPAERYGTAQEFADDLQRFLDDKPIQARRPTLADRARKWMRRHPSFVGAAVLLLVFGLVGFGASTFLIAREQWRTKAAYRELAAQQSRTEAALIAEGRQRELAERDFAQARRAVELIVEFSEGELAHHPGQQDVRRRLLLTLLDYYEEFLADHADDPATKAELAADRRRVALILSELSALRGATLLAVIQDANVQADLGLDFVQKGSIAQVANSQPRPNPRDRGPRSGESSADVEKALAAILTPAQQGRFQQILLQVQQQGRHGFSDPRVVEALELTASQREEIRGIQNETQRAWADHLFTDQKIDDPARFWTDAQDRILAVLDPVQRERWRRMTDPPVAVELREGYPWDGRNVSVPRPGPFFSPPGQVAVVHGKEEFAGSGFGHKIFGDSRQSYAWRGKEIPPTVFEVAVTPGTLTDEERRLLVARDEPGGPPAPDAPRGWAVLFRSDDPSVWNTDSPDAGRFAVPVAQAPPNVRYLRLRRTDTGEALIVPVTPAGLAQQPKDMDRGEAAWNGSASVAFGGRHLGIAETRIRRPTPKGPPGGE